MYQQQVYEFDRIENGHQNIKNDKNGGSKQKSRTKRIEYNRRKKQTFFLLNAINCKCIINTCITITMKKKEKKRRSRRKRI